MLAWEMPVIEPPRAAVFWTFEGTTAGPFFGEVRPGTLVKMSGAAEFVFGDEGIVSVRHIFDFSQALGRRRRSENQTDLVTALFAPRHRARALRREQARDLRPASPSRREPDVAVVDACRPGVAPNSASSSVMTAALSRASRCDQVRDFTSRK